MAFKMLTPEYKLVKIAQKKQRGDVTAVADQLWYSPSHVSNVLAGRRFNTQITNKAYRLATKRTLA